MIRGEFIFGSERDPLGEIGKATEFSESSDFFGVETVRRKDGVDQVIEFLKLGRHRSYKSYVRSSQ
jgi:hypothetical protein